MRIRVLGFCLGVVAAPGCASTPEERTRERARTLLSDVSGESGQLSLRCIPEDAEVSVDGVPRGTCRDFTAPRGLLLGPGMHRVDVKKSGHQPYLTYYESGGAKASLTIELRENPAQGESR